MIAKKNKLFFLVTFLALFFIHCGSKKSSGPATNKKIGPVESAVIKSSSLYKIPARILLSVGYLESRLESSKSSTTYQTDPQAEEQMLSLYHGETAFGLTWEELDLEKNKDRETLAIQIENYARWLTQKLAHSGIKLNPNPITAEDKFQWIWEISQLHRKGVRNSRNVQVIFAKELIQILNAGFIWQDKNSHELIRLEKEQVPLKIESFNTSSQNLFNLDLDYAEIDRAQFFALSEFNPYDGNKPKRILVTHCPFTLSTCLDIQQTENENGEAFLGAHYIIPSTFEPLDKSMHMDRVLQVNSHAKIVNLTNEKGEKIEINDAIVIMLVGSSGRYVNGVRQSADPTWFNSLQLKYLGRVVNDLCAYLEKTAGVNRNECSNPKHENGVKFQVQGNHEKILWGDIPDFDELIFSSYIFSPEGLGGELKFIFENGKKEFLAKDPITLNLEMQLRAKLIEIEELVRCPDHKNLTWYRIRRENIRSTNKVKITDNIYDKGPNENGEHFYRALLYGNKNELMGWAIDRIMVQGFDDDNGTVAPKVCN